MSLPKICSNILLLQRLRILRSCVFLCTSAKVGRLPKRTCNIFPKEPTITSRVFLASSSMPPDISSQSTISELEFEQLSEETLESLLEKFEEIFDSPSFLKRDCDVSYSNGVLSISLGREIGTYVINKQTPNKQIWLSSPFSGPKRYDFSQGAWIYKQNNVSLHELLQNEFVKQFPDDKDFINFHECSNSSKT